MRKISYKSKSLIAYTFSHFCIDFACFFVLFSNFKAKTDHIELVAIGFLIYNIIAFGLQPLIGYLCDEKPKIPIAVSGCFLVAIGLLIMPIPWLSLGLCAVGNACFHIGGGIDSLKLADGKMFRSGIFVSTGALGVSFGTMFEKSENPSVFLPLTLIIISISLIFVFVKRSNRESIRSCTFNIASNLPFAAVIILALFSITIRSYGGSLFPMAWKASEFSFLLPGFASFLGKAFGGILGDRFGAKTVGVFALTLSIPLLITGNNIAVFSLIGIVLFNITMPITLCVIASKLPFNPGLSFGLTTMALLTGNVPTFFFKLAQDFALPILTALIILSAFSTFLSTSNFKGAQTNESINNHHPA